MKYLNYLPILILFFTIKIHSQESVVFKVEYKPNHTYSQFTEQSSSQEINYIGSDEILEKIKSNGIENPTISKTTTKLKNINITGKINNNEFPLTIEFKDTGEKSESNIIPLGTIIYGKVKIGETPTLDSINSPKMESELKQVFLKSIQKGISQVTLPNKEIKIGEPFRKKITKYASINLESYKYCGLWDGRPLSCSSYA